MIRYYQQNVSEGMIGGTMTTLAKLGYSIFNVVPSFAKGTMSYVIIYFKNV